MNDDVPPGAPGEEISAALALVNTQVSGTRGTVDRLATPADLSAWCDRAGLRHAALRSARVDVASVRGLRSVIRGLFTSRIRAVPPATHDVDRLNEAAATVPVVPQIVASPTATLAIVWVPTADGALLLAELARDAIALLTSDVAGRLRECAADDCDRLFVQDHGRRRWCSPACGDRTRASRHYAKVRRGA